MAKFDREFLVPYLQDLCALYMAEQKLENKIVQRSLQVNTYHGRLNTKAPRKPELEYESPDMLLFFGIGMFLIGIIIATVNTLRSEESFFTAIIPGSIMVALGVLFFIMGYLSTKSVRKREAQKFDQQWATYENKLAEHIRNIKQTEKTIAVINSEITKIDNELKTVQSIINEVYGANIIPRYYRNKYVAVYLYDFFSTSRSNDLDMALNIFVLEQIKDRLDVIIETQQEQILNQRMIMANQRKSIEEQREHNAHMRKKACRIAADVEEQNQYLAMIESNTAATAYFAAANYLK